MDQETHPEDALFPGDGHRKPACISVGWLAFILVVVFVSVGSVIVLPVLATMNVSLIPSRFRTSFKVYQNGSSPPIGFPHTYTYRMDELSDEMTFDHGRITVKGRGLTRQLSIKVDGSIAIDTNLVVRPFGYEAFYQQFVGSRSIDGVSCIEYLAFRFGGNSYRYCIAEDRNIVRIVDVGYGSTPNGAAMLVFDFANFTTNLS
ncbi:MAG: hypothetical protein ACYCOU_06525 [Sulfobacillus sp.]